MKNLLLTALALITFIPMYSQSEYKIAKSTGKLILQGIDQINVEGYNGNEIIFSTDFDDHEKNERAKGLKVINSRGLNDNSGIGLSVQENGSDVTVQQISSGNSCNCDGGYTIKVPAGMNIYYEHSHHSGDKATIKDMNGEIEISVNYNDVSLINVAGPLSVKTVYGDLEAVYSSVNQSSPNSLVSVYGFADVSIPADTKADVKVRTNYGALYSDLEIKVAPADGELKRLSSKEIDGKLNGGGVEISISAMYDDVYLRAK